MAWVDPKIASKVARLPGVHAGVVRVRDRLAELMESEFASHDRPGGHEITKQDEEIDALVSIDGPAPLSMEFGHWSGKGENRRYVEGLHIISRSVTKLESEAGP